MLQFSSVFFSQHQHLTFELWGTHSCLSFLYWWKLPGFYCIETETCPRFCFVSPPVADGLNLGAVEKITPITSSFEIRAPWRRWWFWEREPSWLSQVPGLCPDARFRPAPQDQELQRETTEGTIWLRRGVRPRLDPPRDWVSSFSWSKADGQTVFPIFG